MKIKEIIVVEGRDDTNRVKEAIDCDTFETNGSALTKKKISLRQNMHIYQIKRLLIVKGKLE